MDDFNPYQPPQEPFTEPSEVTQRLTRKGFLPFVAGVGCCMASMFVWPWFTNRDLNLALLLLGLILAGFSTGFLSIIAYGWLKFRAGKYGYWRQNPVVLFIIGLLFFPVASLCGAALFLSVAEICPDSVGEVLSPVVLIGSFFAYLELLRFFSQRRAPLHTLP